MVNRELICPKSIVVVGGSNNIHKPGGRLVRNLLEGNYKGELYVVNAKETDVQGLKCYHSVKEIPETELAILSIPNKACLEVVEVLAQQKQVKAFIIISAGFGEETKEGGILEDIPSLFLNFMKKAWISYPVQAERLCLLSNRP